MTTPVRPWNLEKGMPLWMLGSMMMLTLSPGSKVWSPLVIGDRPRALGFFLRRLRVFVLVPLDACIVNPSWFVIVDRQYVESDDDALHAQPL